MKHTIAIIGFGGMGHWHARRLREDCNRFYVKGFFDVRPEITDEAGRDALLAYPDAKALIRDPEVELVLIATPNNFHKDYAIACMRAGKHVICEKPVTMNAPELEAVMAVGHETNRLFTIHQNRRWDTDYAVVKEILNRGEIGAPYFIESRVQGSRGSMHGWRGFRENGGGMLLDWGVHILDQALQLIDSPVISAAGHLQHVFSQEVEDNIKLLLRFENGVSYLAEMSTNCFIPMPRWHVSCTEGTAQIDDWEGNGRILKLKEQGEMRWEDDIVYTAAGPTRTMAKRPEHTMLELPVPKVNADSVAFYENVADVLEGKAKPLVTPEQALRVMRLLDLIFESENKGACISCRI